MDHAGELHPPKDWKRNEMELEPELEAEMRAKVLEDVTELHQKGAVLSPEWLGQIGVDAREATPTALLMNVPSDLGKKRPSKRACREFDAEAIVAENAHSYLVRWEGYHESWEVWRISGEVGSPLETWEPKKNMADTMALEAWRAS
jgi:hypothetical protein